MVLEIKQMSAMQSVVEDKHRYTGEKCRTQLHLCIAQQTSCKVTASLRTLNGGSFLHAFFNLSIMSFPKFVTITKNRCILRVRGHEITEGRNLLDFSYIDLLLLLATVYQLWKLMIEAGLCVYNSSFTCRYDHDDTVPTRTQFVFLLLYC